MNKNTYDLIATAIQDKKQMVATYLGQRRELCPHALGWKNGKCHALFFQFKGGSNSGLPAAGEWRCIPVDRMSNATLRTGKWYSGEGNSEAQTCLDQVDLQVAEASVDSATREVAE